MLKYILMISIITMSLFFSGCSGTYKIEEGSIPIEVLNFSNSTINTTNLIINGLNNTQNEILCITPEGQVYTGVNNSC